MSDTGIRIKIPEICKPIPRSTNMQNDAVLNRDTRLILMLSACQYTPYLTHKELMAALLQVQSRPSKLAAAGSKQGLEMEHTSGSGRIALSTLNYQRNSYPSSPPAYPPETSLSKSFSVEHTKKYTVALGRAEIKQRELTLKFQENTVVLHKLNGAVIHSVEFSQIQTLLPWDGSEKPSLTMKVQRGGSQKSIMLHFRSAEDRALCSALIQAFNQLGRSTCDDFKQLDNEKCGTLNKKILLGVGVKSSLSLTDEDCPDSMNFHEYLIRRARSARQQRASITSHTGHEHTPTFTPGRSSQMRTNFHAHQPSLSSDTPQVNIAITQYLSDASDGHWRFRNLEGETEQVEQQHVARITAGGIQACRGVLRVTNYRISYTQYGDSNLNSVDVPLGAVARVTPGGTGYVVHLHLKDHRDHRVLNFQFDASKQTVQGLIERLEGWAFPHDQKKLFAFSYKMLLPTGMKDGWETYGDCKMEFLRLKLLNSNLFRLVDNTKYSICKSYPPYLIVPDVISDDDLGHIKKYRSKHRLPVITWMHPVTGATMSRCSQPMVGPTRKANKHDQRLLKVLREQSSLSKRKLYIFDARPKIAAVGNRVAGKGYELESDYKDCELIFCNIDNIHAVRRSLRSVAEMCLSDKDEDSELSDSSPSNWFSRLDATGWLHYVGLILKAAARAAIILSVEGASIVVHCSDGWDRTSQLSSLAELMLDSYYRTLEGFAVLIEKDWCSFGHKFAERYGHASPDFDHDQRAPIFTQWLDAVWQITRQFPRAFEFNSEFLLQLLDHVQSCRFGTFLFNSHRERMEAQVPSNTVSVWSHMLAPGHRWAFINPLYKETKTSVIPNCSAKRLVLWEDLHLRWDRSVMAERSASEATVRLYLRYSRLKHLTKIAGLDLSSLEDAPSQSFGAGAGRDSQGDPADSPSLANPPAHSMYPLDSPLSKSSPYFSPSSRHSPSDYDAVSHASSAAASPSSHAPLMIRSDPAHGHAGPGGGGPATRQPQFVVDGVGGGEVGDGSSSGAGGTAREPITIHMASSNSNNANVNSNVPAREGDVISIGLGALAASADRPAQHNENFLALIASGSSDNADKSAGADPLASPVTVSTASRAGPPGPAGSDMAQMATGVISRSGSEMTQMTAGPGGNTGNARTRTGVASGKDGGLFDNGYDGLTFRETGSRRHNVTVRRPVRAYGVLIIYDSKLGQTGSLTSVMVALYSLYNQWPSPAAMTSVYDRQPAGRPPLTAGRGHKAQDRVLPRPEGLSAVFRAGLRAAKATAIVELLLLHLRLHRRRPRSHAQVPSTPSHDLRFISIDSSEPAIAQARLNLALNWLAKAAQAEWHVADVNAKLRQYLDQGMRFDAIVLDPPKLAPTPSHVARAARAYKDINRLACKLLSPGGLFYTYSCSADAGVDALILDRLGSAPDHPMSTVFPEGEYLKGLVLMRKLEN
eukprot:g14987.t1